MENKTDNMITIDQLHAVNPYLGFDHLLHPPRIEGWNSEEPAFFEIMKKARPRLVVEVGAWLGASAIHMGECLARLGLADSKIVCVDTWLGAVEFWKDHADPQRYGALNLVNGYPTVYYQFLANVMHKGLQQTIIPFPQASTIAARWFEWKQIQPDVIYIDGSHDFNDVLADLRMWWPVLKPGGVLFGDDWHTWADVNRAVREFAGEHPELGLHSRGNKWWFHKG